ncbi:MAG TPA: hypothetical protein VI146_07910 [Nitrososphaeraceae archaeon]
MNDSKTMSKIFTADQPQNTKDSSIKAHMRNLQSITYKWNNILIVVLMKEAGMLKYVNSRRILLLLLILISFSLLGYLPEAKGYTRVDDTSSVSGSITCPTGEQHEGDISITSTSTPTMSGYYDIVTATNGGSALKSGVFDYVKINSSGEFILKGKETRDDICGGLTNVSSVPIEITGQCVLNQGSEPPTIVKFKAANGEKADFPSAPNCS